MRRFALLLFIFCASFPAAASPYQTVTTSHQGEITWLGTQPKFGYLFSAGRDGTIRTWNTDEYRMVQILQASHGAILGAALHPIQPELMVLESDRPGSFFFSAWDWQKKERLFTLALKEMPLFFTYSPEGTYFVYGRPDWKSLIFIDSRTGEQLEYLQQGFGIVSYALISASERTIMTYSPGGTISYWDLPTNTLKQRFQTGSGFSNFSVTSDKRYMCASKDNTLAVIDLTTGQMTDKVFMPGLVFTAMNQETDAIACYSYYNGEFLLTWFSVAAGKFSGTPSIIRRGIPGNLTGAVFHKDTLFVSDRDGTVSCFPPGSGEKKEFVRNRILPVYDIAFSGTTMHISTVRNILSIDSDFFKPGNMDASISYADMHLLPNPFGTKADLVSLPENRLLVWKHDDSPGAFAILDIGSGTTLQTVGTFQFPLSEFSVHGDAAISLERNGTIKMFRLSDLSPVFEYTAVGAQTLLLTGKNEIIAGNSSGSLFQAPLLSISLSTGETVPVEDSNTFVYDLVFDPQADCIYSLGVMDTPSGVKTVIKRHRGKNYEQSETLYNYNGEDLGASLMVDPETTVLYTTLGYGSVRKALINGFQLFEKDDHVPRKLYVFNDFVYALNRDSTITAWNKFTGQKALEIFVLEDGNWMLFPAEGGYFGSQNSESPYPGAQMPIHGKDSSSLSQ